MSSRTYRTEVGPRLSEGARLTWKAMEARGWTQADLQRGLLGRKPAGGAAAKPLRPGVVSHWLWGDRLPSGEMLLQIQELFGLKANGKPHVPIASWFEPPKREFNPAKRTGTDG